MWSSRWTRSWSELVCIRGAVRRRVPLYGDHQQSAPPPRRAPGGHREPVHARPTARAARLPGAKPHPLSGVEAGGGDQATSPRHQAQDAGAVKLTAKDWLGAAIALVVAALFVSAGVWQLDRLHQRRARNAEVRARRALAAVAVTAAALPVDSVRDRRVTATGAWDYAHERVWGARTYEGVPGVALLT